MIILHIKVSRYVDKIIMLLEVNKINNFVVLYLDDDIHKNKVKIR